MLKDVLGQTVLRFVVTLDLIKIRLTHTPLYSVLVLIIPLIVRSKIMLVKGLVSLSLLKLP